MFAVVGRRSTRSPARLITAAPPSSAAHGPAVTPSHRTCRPGPPTDGERLSTTTSSPRAARSAAILRPSEPVPPASTTFTRPAAVHT